MIGQPAPRERRSLGGILAILGILAITLFTFGADLFVREPSEEDAPKRLIIDGSFPSAGTDGEPMPVSIGKGRQVLIRIFPASCTSCVRELEELSAIAEEQETELLGIAVGSGTAASTEDRSGEAVVADPDGELAGRLGVDGPPMSLIVGPDGTVLARRPAIPAAELGDLLARARSLSKGDGA